MLCASDGAPRHSQPLVPQARLTESTFPASPQLHCAMHLSSQPLSPQQSMRMGAGRGIKPLVGTVLCEAGASCEASQVTSQVTMCTMSGLPLLTSFMTINN